MTDKDTIIITGSYGKIGSSLITYFSCPKNKTKYQIIGIDIKDGINLGSENDVKTWIKTIPKSQLNKIKVIILAHGMPDLSSQLNQTQLNDFTVEQFQNMINANLTSNFIIIKYLQEYCPSLNHIIFMGSIFGSVVPRRDGYHGKLKNPAYPTSKHGNIGLMKYLAEILGPQKIQVNMISPGPVRDIIEPKDDYWIEFKKKLPLPIPVTLSEIFTTVDFLLQSSSITGQNIILDGGYTLT